MKKKKQLLHTQTEMVAHQMCLQRLVIVKLTHLNTNTHTQRVMKFPHIHYIWQNNTYTYRLSLSLSLYHTTALGIVQSQQKSVVHMCMRVFECEWKEEKRKKTSKKSQIEEVYVRFVSRIAGSYSSTVISERLRVSKEKNKRIKKNNIVNLSTEIIFNVSKTKVNTNCILRFSELWKTFHDRQLNHRFVKQIVQFID